MACSRISSSKQAAQRKCDTDSIVSALSNVSGSFTQPWFLLNVLVTPRQLKSRPLVVNNPASEYPIFITAKLQVATSLVSSVIQGRVQDHPGYHPVEVVRDICREQCVTISYSTVWHAARQRKWCRWWLRRLF